jgi:plastocyanin
MPVLGLKPQVRRMNSAFRSLPAVFALALPLLAGPALAAEPEVLLVIKNHRFEPAELRVPAGQRVKLVVDNRDSTPEEFESRALSREKVVPAGSKAVIYIGPLKAGRYAFVGEYHEATAQGTVVAE